MRDLGSEFCSVCAEQFVRSFWSFDNIRMIEAALPIEASVQVDSCDPVLLSATTPPIAPSTYRYTWTLDGQMLPETTSQVQLRPAALEPGSHRVELLVEDATELVRADPNNLLKDEHSWTVTVSRNDCASGGMSGTAGSAGAPGAGMAGTSSAGGGAGGAGGAAGGTGGADVGGAPVAGGASMAGATGGNGTATPMHAPPPRETAGCGCSLPGSGSPPTPAAFALLALAMVATLRRRSDDSQHAS
jgi:MYXO-CTERM domain-containing protein